MNIMQIGTCRLSLKDTAKYKFTKYFSTVHTASQLLQTIQLLKGRTPPDLPLLNLLFAYHDQHNGDEQKSFLVNHRRLKRSISQFAEADGLVIELSSIKNMVADGWHLHWNHMKGMHPDLQKVKYDVSDDKTNDLEEKIKKIVEELGKPVVFMNHQNRAKLKARLTITEAIRNSNVVSFDPTMLVDLHGFDQMMVDENHFSERMYEEVQKELIQKLDLVFTEAK